MPTTAEIEVKCQAIYARFAECYSQIEPRLPEQARLGHAILYGPPFRQAPIMFVGLQPGGDTYSVGTTWPDTTQYAVENDRLYRSLQEIFGQELLHRCTGANRIFLRAPSLARYRQLVAPEIRKKVEDFSGQLLRELLDIIQPRIILLLGQTLPDYRFDGGSAVLSRSGRVSLVTNGSFFGHRVTAIAHPTGARGVTSEDRKIVQQHLRETVRKTLSADLAALLPAT